MNKRFKYLILINKLFKYLIPIFVIFFLLFGFYINKKSVEFSTLPNIVYENIDNEDKEFIQERIINKLNNNLLWGIREIKIINNKSIYYKSAEGLFKKRFLGNKIVLKLPQKETDLRVQNLRENLCHEVWHNWIRLKTSITNLDSRRSLEHNAMGRIYMLDSCYTDIWNNNNYCEIELCRPENFTRGGICNFFKLGDCKYLKDSCDRLIQEGYDCELNNLTGNVQYLEYELICRCVLKEVKQNSTTG